MSVAGKAQVLSLYKALMRESQKFPNYNFRHYALRRVRDAFKENRSVTDPKTIDKQLEFAQDNLSMLKRQVIIGNLYKTEKLVIENLR